MPTRSCRRRFSSSAWVSFPSPVELEPFGRATTGVLTSTNGYLSLKQVREQSTRHRQPGNKAFFICYSFRELLCLANWLESIVLTISPEICQLSGHPSLNYLVHNGLPELILFPTYLVNAAPCIRSIRCHCSSRLGIWPNLKLIDVMGCYSPWNNTSASPRPFPATLSSPSLAQSVIIKSQDRQATTAAKPIHITLALVQWLSGDNEGDIDYECCGYLLPWSCLGMLV